MKIKNEDHHYVVDYVHARKDEIRADRTEREVIWQEEDSRRYVTCRSCSAINDITLHGVGIEGAVAPCFVCTNCKAHYFVTLDGWVGSSPVICSPCRIRATLTTKEFHALGWTRRGDGCICCFAIRCPDCSKKKA